MGAERHAKSAKRLWQAALRATGHPLAEKLSHQLGRADHSYFVFNLKFKPYLSGWLTTPEKSAILLL